MTVKEGKVRVLAAMRVEYVRLGDSTRWDWADNRMIEFARKIDGLDIALTDTERLAVHRTTQGE